jgi:hypothetical protein
LVKGGSAIDDADIKAFDKIRESGKEIAHLAAKCHFSHYNIGPNKAVELTGKTLARFPRRSPLALGPHNPMLQYKKKEGEV